MSHYALDECVNYHQNPRGDCGGRVAFLGGTILCETCFNRPPSLIRPTANGPDVMEADGVVTTRVVIARDNGSVTVDNAPGATVSIGGLLLIRLGEDVLAALGDAPNARIVRMVEIRPEPAPSETEQGVRPDRRGRDGCVMTLAVSKADEAVARILAAYEKGGREAAQATYEIEAEGLMLWEAAALADRFHKALASLIECDECGARIPDVDGGGLANRHHLGSCSLHDPDQK